jgi:serine/threonine-protein kinase
MTSGAGQPNQGVSKPDPSQAYSLAAMKPQAFDKYTLIGKLGHGGMAEVNLAVADGKGGFRKLTVIKRLHSHLSVEPGFIDMFLDEARLAARLNHPHCVQTYEVGEYEGSHFLSMEYLDGQGLERLLRISGEKDLPIAYDLAARMISDALDGLAYAHELTDYDGTPLNVVHRDVSPQNIFVTYNGMVKLLDFGIAKAATHVVQTKTGVIKGKYAYIAPEQALGHAIDQRSDLWSMGVVLWEVLTGRRLFKSSNELATLHETLQGEIKLPSAFRAELPTDLDTICMRALSRDPAERYQSAQEMKDELDRFLLSLPKAPGRRHVARLMKERFAEVIDLHKTTLAACLKGSGAAMTPSSIEQLMEPASVSGVRPTDPGMTPTPTPPPLGSGAALDATTPPPVAMGAPPAPVTERRGGWIWKAALVVLVIGLAVTAALFLPLGSRDTELADARGAPTETLPTVADLETASTQTVPAVEVSAVAPAATPAAAEESPVEESEESVAVRATHPRGPRRRERREREERPPAEVTAPEAAPGTQNGFLTFATTPWTQVSIGARDLGTTPLMAVELPAGTHTLHLVNREQGIDETYRVTIRAGERLSRRIGLR